MKDRMLGVMKKMWDCKAVWITALLGAVVFVLIYGGKILNPCYTDWLLTSADGDLTQHYLGWKFFRHAKWSFPAGLIDTMAYPNRTSVIFTDSIPLFAFFFKILRFLLPVEFQYFGWFGLLCFMLQGGLGAMLVRKYLKKDLPTVLGGLLFVLSPVFIDRMYWMTSLAAHFLCLLALLFLVYYEEYFSETRRAVIGFGVLGCLCSGIHIYFLPMCGVILLGFVLVDLVKGKKKWRALLPLLSYLTASAATVFFFGGFQSGMKAGNDGVGYYSYNLNGLFNPQGWSKYLKDMPCTDSQYEGFAYLGLGVLLLLAFSLLLWLGSLSLGWKREKGSIRSWAGVHIQEIAYAMIIVIIVVLAASNIVMYHDRVLYEIPIPQFIYKLWSIFRATGRLIWPVVYLALLGAVCMDGKKKNDRAKNLMLMLCLLLQILDIKGVLEEKNAIYSEPQSYQTRLASGDWTMLATETEVKHICFVSDVVNGSRPLLFSFGDYASDYGLTLSNFYFARFLGEEEQQAMTAALEERAADTAFIFFENEAQTCLAYDMNYYKIDGLIVGCSAPLGDLVPLSRQDLQTYRYDMADGRYLNNGEAADGIWTIHSYGNTYGPYLKAGEGRYQVTVTGSGLTATDVKCYYKGGEMNLEPENLVLSENQITYEVKLTEYAGDLEFAVWNIGGADITVSDIVIEKK